MKPKDEKKIVQIFGATLQLVKEKGVAGITMGEIAKAAHIATGTLYIYFKSKDELINALFTECRKASAEMYFMNYDDTQPFKTGFRIIWMNLMKFRLEHFEKSVFIDQCYHSPFITETTKQITRGMIQPLYKLVDRGKFGGYIKDTDNFILLTFIVGGINEFVKHSIYSNKKVTKPMIEQMFRLCWDGIKND